MNKQQIEEWIEANKQLVFVDENHAEHVIPMDKFRKLLKDNAIAPREPSDGLLVSMAMRNNHGFGLLSESAKASALIPMRQIHEEVVGIGFYRHDRDPKYKAMIEASENNPELSQSESKEE